MTNYHLKIIFVLVLCAPIAYFGVRFFMSLVNNAVAGRKVASRKDAGRGDAQGRGRQGGRGTDGRGRGR
ncbi:MAG: hypothetical protein LBG82_08155 [Clostridiales Family XIII bacterium]|jgi:hypothetical protein|nr:hypothetical protein [Clostridiales Family XIII bacterium]